MLQALLVGMLLAFIQLLAALPWLAALDPQTFRSIARKPSNWAIALVVLLIAGAILALFIWVVQDSARLMVWGRLFGAILHAQLTVDFFVLVFPVLLSVWPHGAAVGLAAFREGIRQPLFWLLAGVGAFLIMLVSPFLPYFTFNTGDDFKMVQELGFDTIMILTVIFGVVMASMSISEEIEGRSAITVMSKPVSRRQFLLGKFIGILLAAWLMTGILGWGFTGTMWFKLWFDREQVGDPSWLEPTRIALQSLGQAPSSFVLGMGVWFDNGLATMKGLAFGFCQVMVLLSVAVALATRLPMIVNLVTCLLVYFLGHLTHVLVQVSAGKYALVNFMAKFFYNVLPGLEYFDYGPITVRDVQPDPQLFASYMLSVLLYAVLYSVIALLFGLVLFEDRDLA